MGKPPQQHLAHRSVVVRSLNRPDTKFAVIIAFRTSIFVDNHRTDRLKTADIGNIVGFYPLDSRKPDPRSNLIHRPDRPELLALDLLLILGEHHLRILLRQLDQPLFLAHLWHDKAHLLSPARRQEAGDNLRVL